MFIDWGSSLITWEHSVGATEVVDQEITKSLVKFLTQFGNQELLDIDVTYRRSMDTFQSIRSCSFNDNSLALEAAKQLGVHGRLWETHLDEIGNKAYEFPVAVKIAEVLYYFKTIIYIKGELKEEVFSAVRNIDISFHPSKNGTKVIK